ncbi:MAG: hypothetical protein K2X52_09165 [Mycobacteriaceae bacterium]|nr:hypothetical protein [Mycobacteriaceae bacterium]
MAREDIISNYYETLRWHAEYPIEGVGVVHVVTEVIVDDLEYAFSDVTLVRYRHGRPVEHVPVTGSVCEKMVARCMHEHWRDLQRLARCVRGDVKSLFVLDIDYEIDGDDQDDDSDVSENPCAVDPGWSPRVAAIIARAEGRPVRAPALATR